MSRLQPDKTNTSSIQVKSLTDYKDVLHLFCDLVSSLRGPHGTGVMLQNMHGGHLTMTSSSRPLFSSLSVKKAMIRLFISASQSHLSTFSDGGLFLSCLSSRLVLEGLEMDVNHVFLSDVFEVFLTIILEYLNSPNCCIKIPAYVSDLNFMTSFVNSVIKSKPLCNLNEQNLKHISRLLIECFLTSVDEGNVTSSDSVFIQCQEGRNVSDSFTKQGILIPAPELSRFREKILNPIQCHKNGKDIIKVAMVTVSMSGDMEELSAVKYDVSSAVDFDEVLVDELNQFYKVLIGQKVGLVLCQKVIHPELKYKLREEGVLVVDRIGYQPISYIQSLTGSRPIQCLDSSDSIENQLGWVDSVTHTIIHDKSYLLLKKEGSLVSTVYLCHQLEQHLYELKDVCDTALVSLRHLLYEPFVLPGAGCWQALLASHLSKKVQANMETLSREVGCSENILKDACRTFQKCLIKTGSNKTRQYSVHSRNGHLYRIHDSEDKFHQMSCCCGLYEKHSSDVYQELGFLKSGMYISNEWSDNKDTREITKDYMCDILKRREVILDSFIMCKSALQTSVLTAVSALRIGQVIEDTS